MKDNEGLTTREKIQAFMEGAIIPFFVLLIGYFAMYTDSREWVFVIGMVAGMYSRGFTKALIHDFFKLIDNIKGWCGN